MIKIKGKENIKKQIFFVLMNSKTPITVSMLAKEIDMSGKTVRNYLKLIKTELQNKGIDLVIKPNVGVYLDVTDEERKLLSMGMDLGSQEEKYSPEHRRNYILQVLLKNKDTYTLQLFAEDLYCSKSTIINDLVEVQSWLENRGLQLKRKQNQGLWVEGKENKFRRAMMDLFLESNDYEDVDLENELEYLDYRIDFINYQKIKKLFPRIDLFQIQEVIQQAEKQLGYQFTDQAFINLMTHIAIAIERVKNDKEIKMVKEHFESLKEKDEFQVAQWVVNQLSEGFGLSFSEDEVGYISLHLLGAKIQADVGAPNYDLLLDAHNSDYIEIAKEIISLAGEVLNLDLSADQHLLTALTLHLRPTVIRLKYGLKLRNPILQTIKSEYTSIFGAAWACSSIFEKKLGVSINEDEVGYIAMHLTAGVGRLNQKVKTIIVCSSGIGTSQLVGTRLRKEFPQLEIIATIPFRSLNDQLMQQADLIISTIQGMIDHPKVIHVSTLLDITDLLKIKNLLGQIRSGNFLGKSGEYTDEGVSIRDIIDEDLCFIDDTRDDFVEIINYYGNMMREKGYVKAGFCENVLEREKMGSTIVGKGIAIPHSRQEYVNQSKICIIKLKQPITWNDQRVSLIILLGLKIKDLTFTKAFYKKLYSILNDEITVDQIMKSDHSSDIVHIFLNGGNQCE